MGNCKCTLEIICNKNKNINININDESKIEEVKNENILIENLIINNTPKRHVSTSFNDKRYKKFIKVNKIQSRNLKLKLLNVEEILEQSNKNQTKLSKYDEVLSQFLAGQQIEENIPMMMNKKKRLSQGNVLKHCRDLNLICEQSNEIGSFIIPTSNIKNNFNLSNINNNDIVENINQTKTVKNNSLKIRKQTNFGSSIINSNFKKAKKSKKRHSISIENSSILSKHLKQKQQNINKGINHISSFHYDAKDVVEINNDYSSIEILVEEEQQYLYNIRKNILFKYFSEEMFNFLMDKSEGIQFETDTFVYKEGEKGNRFFIIKEGKIELSSKYNSKTKILGVGEYFGELALLLPNAIRKETAKALEKTNIISIKGTYYRTSLKKVNKNPIKKIIELIQENVLFKGLDRDIILKLCIKIQIKKFKINEIIMNNSNENFICFIYNGDARINYKDGTSQVLRETKFYGHVNLLLDCVDNNFQDVTAINDCECFILEKDVLVDIIGTNYKNIILLNTFINAINNNSYFKGILNDRDVQEKIFELFKEKEYKNGETVFDVSMKNNKKVIFIINGSLYFKEKNYFSSKIQIGEMFGDIIINKNKDLNSPITATGRLIVFEAEWSNIFNALSQKIKKKSSCYDIVKITKSLGNSHYFNSLSESQLLEFASNFVDYRKINKNDTIITNEQSAYYLYFIIKGTVALIYPNQNVKKEIDENNFFCEELLINSKKSPYTAKCLTDCYIVNMAKNKFIEFLNKYENIKNEIKHKINLSNINKSFN